MTNKYKKETKKSTRLLSKGFVFSLEAGIALLLFTLMLFALPQTKTHTAKELALVQQENDLLRVWSAKETRESEMIQDVKLMFGTNATLWVNEKQVLQGQIKKNSISTEGIILNALLQEQKIRIIVYFD
jgi:hypothetical protein